MIASFVLIMALSLGIALWARRGRKRGQGQGHDDARAFFVAGGQFGALLFFFLSVGETYSIATMLGFPGGVYAGGDSFVLWFFGYILLAGPCLYFLGPWIWRAGSLYGSATIPDFFRAHFDSRALEILIAAGAIVLLVPIGTMQFLGMKLVLAALVPQAPVMALLGAAGLLTFAYVALAGLRASAFVAVLKDVLMLGSILLVGALAIAHWNGAGAGTAAAAPAPALPPAAGGGLPFAISTILLQAVGFAMIPQNWAFIFSARDPRAIQRAQVIAPLYMVMFPLLMVVAYFAQRHGIAVPRPDFVFLAVAMALLPGWVVGLVMAAVVLSGLMILSSVCLAIAPLFTRNLVPGLGNRAQQGWSKAVIAVFLALSILATQAKVPLIATLNNVFYFGIVQTLPGFVGALLVARMPARGVLAGIGAAGVFIVWVRLAGVSPGGINPGLIGLAINALVVAACTALWPREGGRAIIGRD